MQDFAFSGLTLSDSASDDISCYECLAQMALLHCACAVTSSGRICVRIPSWTDNTIKDHPGPLDMNIRFLCMVHMALQREQIARL